MSIEKDSSQDKVEILVVEDSPTQAERLRYMLEQHNYSVSIAQNGKQALTLLSQHKPTLVISDIMMPEVDGYQLCQQIKTNERLKDIPVILLTSLSDSKDVIRGLECGADNFITKPYDEEYLLSRLHYILANKEVRRGERVQMGVEIIFGGQKHFITSDRQQILDLLISTYEAAVQKNIELTKVQDELYALNEHLEELVEERTAALTAEIAERKRGEAALRESEERFRATFEQAAVGIAHVGLDGRWLRVNQKLCHIVGYTREELLEKTFQEITHPEDLETDLAYVRKVLAGDIPTYSMEKRCICKDGSFIWIDLTVSLVRELSGEPKYFISVIEDITQHKSLEEQFRQAQKMEAIGRLSGGVAHDFNNLLVVINGYSELLLQRYLPEGDSSRRYVEEIEKAGERAAALTRQLLTFSRQQVLQPQVLNLNEVVADMEKMLQRLIGEDVELIIVPRKEVGQIKADPGQLEQVIMNMVVNARDAMPQGGKLIIETANAELDEMYARQHLNVTPGLYVMLTVSDTGIGMDAKTRSRIFEPFFTTKEQGKGTGLGLATVYGIVKQSGGDIWLYSEPGRGTTFKIYLPRVEEVVSVLEPQPGLSTLPPGEETVLLVEDEEAVRNLAHQSLELGGYTVLVASQGAEALLLGEQQPEPIHLLVTDVVMPGGMNGQELAERLKALRPELKVLFISGYTDEAIVHHGVLKSGLFLLQKPFTPNTLLRKAREVLDTPLTKIRFSGSKI